MAIAWSNTGATSVQATCDTGTETFGFGASDGISLANVDALDVFLEAAPGQQMTGSSAGMSAALQAWLFNGASGRWARAPDLDLAPNTAILGGAPCGFTSATGSTTGGTLVAGTYYYLVTALGPWGETAASSEKSGNVSSGSTGSVALVWTNPTGTVANRVYRGTATGAENVYYQMAAATTYTDTNAATTGSGSVPVEDPRRRLAFVGASPGKGLPVLGKRDRLAYVPSGIAVSGGALTVYLNAVSAGPGGAAFAAV